MRTDRGDGRSVDGPARAGEGEKGEQVQLDRTMSQDLHELDQSRSWGRSRSRVSSNSSSLRFFYIMVRKQRGK